MDQSICLTFKELAAQTWRRLGQAAAAGLAWSEETNTETMLLTLHERHPRQVVVQAVDKAKEALNGADWEWWLGSPGAWFGMRVQAKRIKLPQERFDRVFSQKARNQSLSQIETLISAAFRDRVTPAYCFYVFSKKWPPVGYWPDRYTQSGEGTPLGCLIAHASAVNEIKSTTLPKIAAISAPWHMLVCPEGRSGQDRGAAISAHHVLHQSAAAADARGLLAIGTADEDFPLFDPVSELPDHAQVLLYRATGKIGGADSETIAGRARERGLAGIALISSAPLGDA